MCRFKNVSVCTVRTSRCVPGKRPCGRFAATHGGVLNVHTDTFWTYTRRGFPRAKPRHTQTTQQPQPQQQHNTRNNNTTHTTHTTHHTLHTNTSTDTHSQHIHRTHSQHTRTTISTRHCTYTHTYRTLHTHECLDMHLSGNRPCSWDERVNAWICAQSTTDRDFETKEWMLGYVLVRQPILHSFKSGSPVTSEFSCGFIVFGISKFCKNYFCNFFTYRNCFGIN